MCEKSEYSKQLFNIVRRVKEEHKKIIRLILEDKFNEFYYASDTQFIYYSY